MIIFVKNTDVRGGEVEKEKLQNSKKLTDIHSGTDIERISLVDHRCRSPVH